MKPREQVVHVLHNLTLEQVRIIQTALSTTNDSYFNSHELEVLDNLIETFADDLRRSDTLAEIYGEQNV